MADFITAFGIFEPRVALNSLSTIMTKTVHRIYIGTFVLIIIATTASLIFLGASYYATPLEERFYHDSHKLWKPSGPLGHGLGIIGTLFILIGALLMLTLALP